jgi:hypothetical protein
LSKDIPNALGCPTAGVSTLILIIIVQQNTPSDYGVSVEYISTGCPSEENGFLEDIPNALGYQNSVVSTLIWIIIVHKNTICDAGMCVKYN